MLLDTYVHGVEFDFVVPFGYFLKKVAKNNFLIFSNHLAFLAEQICTDDADIEKYAINRCDF